MLEGKAVYGGLREVTSKKTGNTFTIFRMINSVSGEMAELFLADGVQVPKGLSILEPIKVKVDWTHSGNGTRFRLIEVSKSV